jgi:hypothetical protein
MPKTKTHFDQVPVRLIKEKIAMAEAQAETMTVSPDVIGKPSSPENEPYTPNFSGFSQERTMGENDTNQSASGELMYSKWQKFYEDALLELDREKLRMKVVAAEKAMRDRLEEIAHTGEPLELQAIEDAIGILRALTRTELSSQ